MNFVINVDPDRNRDDRPLVDMSFHSGLVFRDAEVVYEEMRLEDDRFFFCYVVEVDKLAQR